MTLGTSFGEDNSSESDGTQVRSAIIVSMTRRPRSLESDTSPTDRRQKEVQSNRKRDECPEERDALRRAWSNATTFASILQKSALLADPIAVYNAFRDLNAQLTEMWIRRGLREDSWKKCLNFLQGIAETLLKERRVESLTPDQCDAISDIVSVKLSPATTTELDVSACVRMLIKVELNPFEAIAG